MTESVNFITGVVAGFFIGSFVTILMLIVSEPIGRVVEKGTKAYKGELLKSEIQSPGKANPLQKAGHGR